MKKFDLISNMLGLTHHSYFLLSDLLFLEYHRYLILNHYN